MSQPLNHKIREAARKLLHEKQAHVVIGFEWGTLPLRSRPCFIRREEDVDRFVWNGFCEVNLARYLPNRKEKTAIVAKACDSRAIVELVKENQVARDQVIIIGVPCAGMIDRARVEALERRSRSEAGRLGAVLDTEGTENRIVLKGRDFEMVFDRREFLYDYCFTCSHRTPPLHDILLDRPTVPEAQDLFADVEAFGALDHEERWGYLTGEIGRCIRCYACRNVCPLCHCPECFVDGSRPQWVGRSTNLSDTMIFHIVRAYHLAGRCVDCGACEQACPMGVDIRKLNRRLLKDVRELFNYEAGLSLETASPLATFRPDDCGPAMVDV